MMQSDGLRYPAEYMSDREIRQELVGMTKQNRSPIDTDRAQECMRELAIRERIASCLSDTRGARLEHSIAKMRPESVTFDQAVGGAVGLGLLAATAAPLAVVGAALGALYLGKKIIDSALYAHGRTGQAQEMRAVGAAIGRIHRSSVREIGGYLMRDKAQYRVLNSAQVGVVKQIQRGMYSLGKTFELKQTHLAREVAALEKKYGGMVPESEMMRIGKSCKANIENYQAAGKFLGMHRSIANDIALSNYAQSCGQYATADKLRDQVFTKMADYGDQKTLSQFLEAVQAQGGDIQISREADMAKGRDDSDHELG